MAPLLGWFKFKRLGSYESFRLLLLILCGLTVLLFVAQAKRLLPVSSENIIPESAGVLAAQSWARGVPLYSDYRQSPYWMTAFPPLWYACMALAAKAGLTDLNSLTLFGRLLSLACLFGIGAVGYLWNRGLKFAPQQALLTPAFFLAFPVLIPWAVTARPDFLALLLGLVALYWAGSRSTTGAVVGAGIVAGLAFLTRHNAVAVPVALVLWMVWSRRWKHAGLFCCSWALVVGVALVPFQFFGNDFLLLNLSSAKFGPLKPTYIHDVLNHLLVAPASGLAVVLFALGALGLLVSWKDANSHVRLLNVYFVVCFLLAIVGSAAAGASANHFLEAALAASLLVPVAMAGLQSSWRDDSPLGSLAIILTLALLLPAMDAQRFNLTHSQPENLAPVVSLMQNKRIFTDDSYLAARSSTPEAIDLASLINTERTGGWASWSSEKLAQMLRDKKYELVILRTPMAAPYVPYDPDAAYPRYPLLDTALQTAITRNYGLCTKMDALGDDGPRFIYGPLSAQSGSTGPICPPLQSTTMQFKLESSLQ